MHTAPDVQHLLCSPHSTGKNALAKIQQGLSTGVATTWLMSPQGTEGKGR